MTGPAAGGTVRAPASTHRGPVLAPAVVLAIVVAVPIGLVYTLDRHTYDIWGGFIWGPVVLLAMLPLCRWAAARTGEPDVVRFLMGAALLKVIVGPILRWSSAEVLYGGLSDASRYDNAGALLAPQLRVLDLSGLGRITGTRFVEVLTGAVQAVIGETRIGTFFVFSAFGFVGMCLLYLAFCEALPSGDRRLYRRFLFLLPTMWYWPSSIGKEAFLMLCLGGAAYGLARVFSGHVAGLVPGLLGAWGLAVIRPHLVLILLVGVAAALAFPDSGPAGVVPEDGEAGEADEAGAPGTANASRALAIRVLAVVVILALLPALLGSVERFFKIEGLNLETVGDVRDEVARRTEQGGGEFSPPDTATPFGFAAAVVTVLIRPFPWEAGGNQVFAALEGVLAALIGVACIARRWADWPRAMWRRWSRFAIGYVLAFSWAFSAVGNFGIIARQRSLMYPMLFVLVAAASRREAAPVASPGPARWVRGAAEG